MMLFYAANIFGQSGWVIKNPEAPGNGLKVYFINDQTGWMCGYQGIILKTTNSGGNWTRQFTNSSIIFYSIDFIDENFGWAVGNGGKVIKTTDGGANWELIQTITNRYLYDVKFFNSLTGIVSGGFCTILRTTDGGLNWAARYSGNYEDEVINYIKVFENTKIFVTGNAVSLISTDSGITWNAVSNNFSDVRANFYLDSLNGWRATGQQIHKTTNLGVNWSAVYSGAGIYRFLYFINNMTGFNIASTLDGRVVNKTTNGGASWNMVTALDNSQFNFLYFVNQSTGFVGRDNGTILKTTNTGDNWNSIIIANSITSNTLYDVDFINSQTGWVIGNLGTLLKTTNGGVNWSLQQYSTYPQLTGYQISALSSDTVYLSTYFQSVPSYWGNKIMKSVNGGSTWNEINTEIYSSYLPLCFINSTTGWFCRYNAIASTVNGGLNWYTIGTLGGLGIYNLHTVQFINTSTGWVLSDTSAGSLTGRFHSTTDGGNTWKTTILPQSFSRLYFINSSTGFLYSGKIIKTTNSGLTWQEKLSGSNFDKIKFINDFTGYCVADGYIYKTTNIGENWFADYDNSNYSYKSIDFVNESTGFVVGSAGVIMKTTTGGTVFVSQTSSTVPDKFSLRQNYPNPFNPSTVIRYQLSVAGNVSLKVFDLLGKEVATLVNEKQNAGSYAVDFNSAEFNLPSGIYFYTLSAGEFKETRKMVLVK
ncbi:MAG: T9SS type A sorting domain-containing protein [Ignavibacteria bacterium]|nr:T9SS type A sorting domain-containing protein [Ignavibacteria bacterium]